VNKKEFLDSLEKKLSVLEDNEKQDIIIEYTDTINEKIKQGQTEEEAIKDFGNIDDLVKEILIAYKINPNYEDKQDNFSKKGEELIKQGAEAMSDLGRKVAKKCNITSKDISLEFIAEIIIRIFIVLIALLILKGVFTIFSELGESIFDSFYSPLGSVFVLFWNVLLFAIFILVTVLMVIALFKKYFKLGESHTTETTEEMPKEINKTSKTKNTNNKEIKKTIKTPKEKKGASLGDVCLLIVKIFVIIYVIIPFIVIDSLTVLGLILSIIYLIKGINLIGLLLLLIGMSTLFTYIIKLLFSLLFGKGKASIIPVIISIVMMIIGTIMFVDMIMNIEVIDSTSNDKDQTVETKSFNATKKTYIHYAGYSKINKKIDENMLDGQFTITLKYNKDKQNIQIEEDQNYLMNDCDYIYMDNYDEYEDEYESYQECTQSTYYFINIYNENNRSEFNEFKEEYNNFIENLKDNKFYNMDDPYKIELTITANEKTMHMIKTN